MITDDYSRFLVIHVISSLSAKVVIPKLDRTFSEFGIPDVVRSDNGPPFSSHEFKQFAIELGFRHRKITPLWPRANAEVERFMRTIKKSHQSSHCISVKLEIRDASFLAELSLHATLYNWCTTGNGALRTFHEHQNSPGLRHADDSCRIPLSRLREETENEKQR